MGSAGKIVRNAAAMMSSQGITWATSFVLIIYLPRRLGAADYGKMQWAVALTGMFSILIDFGTSVYITREVARDRKRAQALLANVVLLKTALSLVACVVMMGAVLAMHRGPEMVTLVGIYGAAAVLFSMVTIFDSFLNGFEEMHYVAWGLAIEKVPKTAIMVLLLLAGYRLVPLALATLALAVLHVLWSGWWALRVVRPARAEVSLAGMRDLMAGSLPFFLFAVFNRIYDKIDVTMLGMMASDAVVGWYGAAYRLFQSLFFLPNVLYVVTLPVLSRLSAEDKAAYQRVVDRTFSFLCATAVGVSIGTFVLARPICDRLYTPSFTGTAPALRILAFALLCMYLNAVFVMVLQTSDLQMRWTRAAAVAAFVNPTVNYLLIPRFGHLGAAATTVVTEGLLLGMAISACPRGIFGRRHLLLFLRALGAGAVLAAGMAVGLRWGMVPAAILGFALYAGALLRLGVVSKADLALLRTQVAAKFASRGKVS